MKPSTPFLCENCKETKTVPENNLGTGYGCNEKGEKICYECCAKEDLKTMRATGKATMYLVDSETGYMVTNWPGTLAFKCTTPRKGRHNITRSRYDIWFQGPDNKIWHGIQYGDDTQICHVKRTKSP